MSRARDLGPRLNEFFKKSLKKKPEAGGSVRFYGPMAQGQDQSK